MKEIKATAPTPQDWIELARENERLAKRGDDYLSAMQKIQEVADVAVQAGVYQQKRAEKSELERVKEAALVMANARRIVKRTTMSNAKLFMELHGSGYGTARSYCRDTLGLDPDSRETDYSEMMSFIGEQNK